MRGFFPSLVVALGLAASAQSSVLIDFEGANDLANHFRITSGTMIQSSNGAANDFVTLSAAATALYDTDGSGPGTQPFTNGTVSVDFRLTNVFDRAAILVRVPNTGNAPAVSFQGRRSLLSVYSNYSPTTTGGGSGGVIEIQNNTGVDAAINTWYTLKVDFSDIGGALKLSAVVHAQGNPGSVVHSISHTYAASVYTGAGQVGFASNFINAGGGGAVQFDNFSVPEPASIMLAVGGGLLLLRRRTSRLV